MTFYCPVWPFYRQIVWWYWDKRFKWQSLHEGSNDIFWYWARRELGESP